MNEYKHALGKFSERIKNAEIQKPLQEVKPVQKKAKLPGEEVQLMIWIEKGLMKKVKLLAIDQGKSIKEFVTEAMKNFIEKQ